MNCLGLILLGNRRVIGTITIACNPEAANVRHEDCPSVFTLRIWSVEVGGRKGSFGTPHTKAL